METALTLAQVAKLLQVAPSTIHTMIREEDETKRIPYIRVGKSYRFFGSELAKFFNMDVSIVDQFFTKENSK
jgi:excisionase family DNA binding protein